MIDLATRTAIADSKGIAEAARILREGGLVAFPTETVYGLGADATNGQAVAAIFAAKGRPLFNPLIVHVADLEEARRHVELSPRAQALAEKFWPGALTLVLPRRKNSPLSLLVSAGLDTVALRAPSHPAAIALLRETGRPVAGPSANRSGQVTATMASHVAESLGGNLDFILDAGVATLGIESTVVGFDGDRPLLLRPGAIPREEIEDLIGPLGSPGSLIQSPGQLASHYAPAKPLRIDATSAAADEYWIGFGPLDSDANLSPTGDLAEAATRLFDLLHQTDESNKPRIAIAPIPDKGLGAAINDRLRRAAA